jgi:hypothetical protein
MEGVAVTVAKVSLGPVRSRLPAEPGSVTMLARTIGLPRQRSTTAPQVRPRPA